MPPSDHGGLPARLLGFAEELRDEGVAIGTSELLDAFAALDQVPWTEREDVREALAATLAKSQEDRRVFELVFERFFFRAAEAEALDREVREDGGVGGPEEGEPSGAQIDLEALRAFEAQLRRELERALIERTRRLPSARPLNELDRALPSGPLQDLAAVHRIVAQLKRRLATQGQESRGRRRHAHVDIRRTMRASLQTGGVPIVLKYRPRRPRRPEIYVLCDVSTSVTSASVFFLSVLHALHDSFRKLRSFVFIERVSEVTEIFERERNFKAVSERIASDAGVADISGYTDYGRVWSEFLADVEDDLHPRATVIVLGDARTNGRDPRADVFAQVAARAGRTFWLNPEPRLYWNYGDSVIAAYERYCTAFECWTTAQLEDFVRALTRPVLAAAG